MLFGTDGIRGLANGEVLTPELALALARSAGQLAPGGTAVIGRDTRPSGPMLEAAAAAGFASAGLTVVRLGVVPTPTVAYACARGLGDLGLMVSASHNPMPDNGLKLFGPGGWKLDDEAEARIGAGLQASGQDRGPRPHGTSIGDVRDEDVSEDYLAALLRAVPEGASGVKVVVDGAQGSASRLAPELYRRAGAEVRTIFCDGTGARINDGCGATHLEAVQAEVVRTGADLGLAHDGDADRCLAVDANGTVVDGDQILALLAVGLEAPTVVATVMSNLGFVQAMDARGIAVEQTKVGDRYVLEALRAGGHTLGGEQSGHLIRLDHSTTGDGLLTGLSVLGLMSSTGRTLADLASVMTRLPQVLINVKAPRERAHSPQVTGAAAREQIGLGDRGRVLLRASGTEALVRVMVEAPTEAEAREVAERLAKYVKI